MAIVQPSSSKCRESGIEHYNPKPLDCFSSHIKISKVSFLTTIAHCNIL